MNSNRSQVHNFLTRNFPAFFLSSTSQSDATTTTNTTKHRETPCEKFSPTPIYPVNRPNLAATLRYEWSREKIKRYKDVKESMMRDKFRKPSWGVKNMHAFQQLAHE
jgi:hypothetical protein